MTSLERQLTEALEQAALLIFAMIAWGNNQGGSNVGPDETYGVIEGGQP